MTTPELPPLPNPPLEYRHEGCTYIDRESFLEWHDQHSARERILLARVERLELTVQEFGLRNAELEADAERYRWLRSRVPGGAYRIMGVIYSEGGAGVDAAIDAARGAK